MYRNPTLKRNMWLLYGIYRKTFTTCNTPICAMENLSIKTAIMASIIRWRYDRTIDYSTRKFRAYVRFLIVWENYAIVIRNSSCVVTIMWYRQGGGGGGGGGGGSGGCPSPSLLISRNWYGIYWQYYVHNRQPPPQNTTTLWCNMHGYNYLNWHN